MSMVADSRAEREPLAALLGAAAVAFSVLYLLSDTLELVQGGFSMPQLLLTYVAEAAIPIFVLGLYAAQRPHIGALGLVGEVAYACIGEAEGAWIHDTRPQECATRAATRVTGAGRGTGLRDAQR